MRTLTDDLQTAIDQRIGALEKVKEIGREGHSRSDCPIYRYQLNREIELYENLIAEFNSVRDELEPVPGALTITGDDGPKPDFGFATGPITPMKPELTVIVPGQIAGCDITDALTGDLMHAFNKYLAGDPITLGTYYRINAVLNPLGYKLVARHYDEMSEDEKAQHSKEADKFRENLMLLTPADLSAQFDNITKDFPSDGVELARSYANKTYLYFAEYGRLENLLVGASVRLPDFDDYDAGFDKS